MQRFVATMDDTGHFAPASLPEGFAYATLGPNSLVDLVDIAGTVLGQDEPVRLSGGPDTLTRVRPLRPDGDGEVNNVLELTLWRCDETPVACKRNPAVATDGATVGFAAYERRIRLPFAGRRAGAIHICGDIGKAFDYSILGVKYLDTKAVGGAARCAYIALASGTETPANATGSGGVAELAVFLGGLDTHVDCDEIEVWLQGDGGLAVELDTRGEAYDLCR